MTDGYGTTHSCPYCDACASALYQRTAGSKANRTVDPEKDWFCRDCCSAFDEPGERERRQPANIRQSGLAKTLDEMDPNEIGGEKA